jgi:predicted secreted protein
MQASAWYDAEIRVGDGATPTQNYVPLDEARLTRLELQQQHPEMTKIRLQPWAHMAQAAVQRALLDISGALMESAAQRRLVQQAISGQEVSLQIKLGAAQQFSGAFAITRLQLSAGASEALQQFQLQLQSSGEISWQSD